MKEDLAVLPLFPSLSVDLNELLVDNREVPAATSGSSRPPWGDVGEINRLAMVIERSTLLLLSSLSVLNDDRDVFTESCVEGRGLF